MTDRLPEYLVFAELQRFVPYSRFHIARLEAAGKFPKRIKLGEGAWGRIAWRTSDVLRWLKERAAATPARNITRARHRQRLAGPLVRDHLASAGAGAKRRSQTSNLP